MTDFFNSDGVIMFEGLIVISSFWRCEFHELGFCNVAMY